MQGPWKHNAYIITQMPLPHTVIDFWRMVFEQYTTTIVMLNAHSPDDAVSVCELYICDFIYNININILNIQTSLYLY